MKKVLFTLAALLSLVSAIAQEGEIIYTDYEPDLHVYTPYPFYSMDVDLDFDSIPDIQLYFNRPGPASSYYAILAINDDFEIAQCSEGDVIPDLEYWAQEKSLYFESQSMYAFRQQKGNGYCYGWIRAYCGIGNNQGIFFDAFAYCTAVDYPLKWGQENILQGNHYDFSAVCETGQTLYYKKRDTGPYYVEIVCPNANGWASYNKPEGDIIFPSSVKRFGITYMVEAIGDSAFYYCQELTGDLTIPTTVKSVGAMAFKACRNFDGVLTLPNSITHLGKGAFWWCESLTGTVRFPNHLTEIDSLVLFYCHSIEAIEIPASVTHIARGSLSGSKVMTSIIVDENNPNYYSENNALIERETKELIAGCMTTIIPEDVVSIEPCAFIECGDGGDLVIPNSVTAIGEGAFSFSQFSGNLTLPENLTTISERAFMDSKFQGELIIPEGVLYLLKHAFNSMHVTSVTIPSTVQYIGEECFLDCCRIQSLKVNCVVPPEMEENSFKNVDMDIPVYIPVGTLAAYRNARYWEQFNNFVEDTCAIQGSEWFYEIQNSDGSITYQHLQCSNDTVIENKRPKIIIRSNTLYDEKQSTTVTHEYVYEENGIVYWWNKTLNEFTVLYNLNAEAGDEWQIKVGTETITVHVDAVDDYDYEGRTYKMLQVSDENDVFSGTIVCGIGHLTSFFPERLMSKSGNYRVEGMRCYWKDGELVFKYGDKDCDEIYIDLHNGIEESDNQIFRVYPNPAKGFITIETEEENAVYEIVNIMGQTVLSGSLNGAKQVNVSELSDGMYFIKVGQEMVKFVVGK